jgi:hypothetical protein
MSDIEERLRAALRARGRDFTVSPDAWQGVLARRQGAPVPVPSSRSGWRHLMTPFAAAAAIAATVVVSVLLGYAVPWGGSPSSGGPAPRTAPSGHPQPSPLSSPVPNVCSTSTPAAKTTTPAVSGLSITPVSLASAPNGVKYYAHHVSSPSSAIVRVSEDLGGVPISAYIWITGNFANVHDDSLAAVVRVGPAADNDPADGYKGQFQSIFPISRGHSVNLSNGDGTHLYMGNSTSDLVQFGLATSQVAGVTITPGGGGPIPGSVLSARGFPYKVWMIAFPAVPNGTSTLTFRDTAGKVLASGPYVGDMTGSSCHPVAGLDYRPTNGASTFSVGVSLPEVSSVTAVLPDGQQISGGFLRVPLVQQYYREWQVTYPIADANVQVKLVFRNAAGQVVDTLTTVPGEPSFGGIKPWW